ncbi:hypothetical protein FEM48_Zijuj03G0140500 [Ziziphus jujuba var. spinosa]|uniref:Pectinesterase inhibitor domain-containing protein n=1 Tax=Ziziphus jujuba var. spinosa TaxID=714518 RepID=A0A978VQR0_ZIZJJ|nr:hypothetical protein FEM48_Zijuj03G0140500 [Ziziphus jujuba var. spinosa]
MENSVDELKGSLLAMRNLEGADFDLEKSNIQTWVSAALTEEDKCLDGLEESAIDGDIKALIRSNIVRVDLNSSPAKWKHLANELLSVWLNLLAVSRNRVVETKTFLRNHAVVHQQRLSSCSVSRARHCINTCDALSGTFLEEF